MVHPLLGTTRYWLLCAALLTMAAANASSPPPLAERARDYLRTQLEGQAEIAVDSPGAHFPPCENPRFFLPGNGQKLQGRISVGVRCGQQDRTRYLQANVTLSGTYWVTTRDLQAGEPLDAASLTTRQGNLSRLPNDRIDGPAAIEGRVATRRLTAGTILRDSQLRKIPLVERRQSVTIEARGQGFRIHREGRALDTGGRGDRIRVRLPNREILQARVAEEGRVVVVW